MWYVFAVILSVTSGQMVGIAKLNPAYPTKAACAQQAAQIVARVDNVLALHQAPFRLARDVCATQKQMAPVLAHGFKRLK